MKNGPCHGTPLPGRGTATFVKAASCGPTVISVPSFFSLSFGFLDLSPCHENKRLLFFRFNFSLSCFGFWFISQRPVIFLTSINPLHLSFPPRLLLLTRVPFFRHSILKSTHFPSFASFPHSALMFCSLSPLAPVHFVNQRCGIVLCCVVLVGAVRGEEVIICSSFRQQAQSVHENDCRWT